MRSSIILLAAAVTAVSAAPATASERDEIALMKRNYIARLEAKSKLAKRQSVTSGVEDAGVLNFALTLEHLENTFYTQALNKFDNNAFNSAGYNGAYALLKQVSADEAQHVAFLTSALSAAGATPVQACNYTFPYTTVQGFLGLSQVIEGVGVSAYLGAAGDISSAAYTTAAGSILTVEARHNAFVRFLDGYSPFPQPEDTPLSATAVVTLVAPFFGQCPTGSAPSIAGKPALALNTTSPMLGGMINIGPKNASAFQSTGTVYCGFASGLATAFSTWTNNQCMIPSQNVTGGQNYVFLTSGPSVADGSVLAGPAVIELGAMNFTVSQGKTNSSSGSSGSNGSSGSSGSSTPRSAATAGAKLSFAGVLAAIGGAFALLI